MKTNLVPIEELIKETIDLSDNPIQNKKRLEEIRELVIKQVRYINKYDIDDLRFKMSSSDTSNEDYLKYADIMDEFTKYATYNEKISMIIDRKYTKLSTYQEKNQRKIKQIKIVGFAIASVLIISGELYIRSLFKNNSKEDNNTIVVENTDNRNSNEKQNEITTKDGTTYKSETKDEPYQEEVKETVIKEETVVETNNKGNNISEAEQRTVVDLFKDMNDDTLNNDGSKSARKKAKGFVVNTIDFIFFNSSINGITFDDLKDDFKQEIYGYLKSMDKVVMSFDPDYKETLGEKYNAIKDFSKEKLGQAKEIIINHIGQERYDAIIKTKNEILNTIKEGFTKYGGKALKYLKDKYLEWKEE